MLLVVPTVLGDQFYDKFHERRDADAEHPRWHGTNDQEGDP